jgi:hypothetical protein
MLENPYCTAFVKSRCTASTGLSITLGISSVALYFGQFEAVYSRLFVLLSIFFTALGFALLNLSISSK